MGQKRTFSEKLTVAAVILGILTCVTTLLIITSGAPQYKDIRITTTGGDLLVFYGTATDHVDSVEVTDAWLVGYELSDAHGGMHTMNRETVAEVLQTLREVSDTLEITESTDTNIREARLKIETIIRIIEESEMPQDAST